MQNNALQEIFSLQDKVAVITGGAVNIGRAITLKLATAGAKIAVIYHQSDDAAQKLSTELSKLKTDSILIQADLCSEEEVIEAFKKIDTHFGRIDILVNNAGVFGLSLQEDLSLEGWNQVFDLNMRGLFLCTRQALQSMKKTIAGQGIVNIASMNGLHPGFGKTAHYDATKGAVIAYTKSLAAELAERGIRVNAVAPGLVDSENLRKYAADLAGIVEKRTPLKKIAKANDIANTVLFLASAASSHITGETIVVDGGYLLS